MLHQRAQTTHSRNKKYNKSDSRLPTDDDRCQQSDGEVWGQTPLEEGLQDVVGEGEGNDGVARGHDDHQGNPQVQEGRQGPERVPYVRVVPARLVDHRACTRGGYG